VNIVGGVFELQRWPCKSARCGADQLESAILFWRAAIAVCDIVDGMVGPSNSVVQRSTGEPQRSEASAQHSVGFVECCERVRREKHAARRRCAAVHIRVNCVLHSTCAMVRSGQNALK